MVGRSRTWAHRTELEIQSMKHIPYRKAICSLLLLALGTRPDISYAVGQVAKFNAHPGLIHWNTVLKILYRSLVDCVDTHLVMFKSENDLGTTGNRILSGYSDVNYTRDIKYHFVRELVENKTLAIQYVPTVDNLADIFTKPLVFSVFTKLRAAFLSFV